MSNDIGETYRFVSPRAGDLTYGCTRFLYKDLIGRETREDSGSSSRSTVAGVVDCRFPIIVR